MSDGNLKESGRWLPYSGMENGAPHVGAHVLQLVHIGNVQPVEASTNVILDTSLCNKLAVRGGGDRKSVWDGDTTWSELAVHFTKGSVLSADQANVAHP